MKEVDQLEGVLDAAEVALGRKGKQMVRALGACRALGG